MALKGYKYPIWNFYMSTILYDIEIFADETNLIILMFNEKHTLDYEVDSI